VTAAAATAPQALEVGTYRPSEKQGLFHASPAKFRLLLGAWGSGKTKMLVWEDILLALEFPGSLGVVYRKTYPALRDTTKRDYITECPPEIIANIVKSEGREEIEFINGSKTLFRSLDDYKKLGSTQFDRISVDEALELTKDDFLMLSMGRLRGKVGPLRMMLATNPPNRDHWAYDFFVEHATTDTAVFHYSTHDNVEHLPAEYVARLESMPEAWKKKYVRGEWGIAVDGAAVFGEFREAFHVTDGKAIPGVPILRGWDFGFHHPACCWVQVAPTGHVVVLHELMGKDLDLRAFGQQVIATSDRLYPYADFVDYCDAAGSQVNDRGPSATDILRREFKLHPRFRRMGIHESIERLRYLLGRLTNGRPLLQFDRSCVLLIDAFGGGYIMEEHPQPGKELPKKDNYYDHLVDALRYCVVGHVGTAVSPYAGKPFPSGWRATL
jgi:hypothetical protein